MTLTFTRTVSLKLVKHEGPAVVPVGYEKRHIEISIDHSNLHPLYWVPENGIVNREVGAKYGLTWQEEKTIAVECAKLWSET